MVLFLKINILIQYHTDYEASCSYGSHQIWRMKHAASRQQAAHLLQPVSQL